MILPCSVISKLQSRVFLFFFYTIISDMKKNIENIRELISFVWYNQFSDFYRKKYQVAGFDEKDVLNPKNFDKLPFLTRQELESVSPDERLFIDPQEVQFVAYTSGTSSGRPMITYFTRVDDYYFDPTLSLGVRRLLIIHPPLNKHFHLTFVQQCIQSKNKSFPVFADYQNLANSAVIAAEIRADAVYATPTIALMFGEFLRKYYDPKKIKLLALGSETLTSTHRNRLKTIYPNAQIADLYGSAEIGQYIFYPCPKIVAEEKSWFHVLQPPLIKAEIIEGELVITYANNKAMPLIRYRTSDYFKIVSNNCGCGIKGPIFAWSGRKGVDKVKVAGVEIKIEDVERVFNKISHLTGDKYQLHFYESRDESGIKIVVEIIEPATVLKILPPENVKETIINHLMNNWHLSSTAKLKDVTDRGLFLTPEVKFVKEFSFKSAKTKHLVSHLSENN